MDDTISAAVPAAPAARSRRTTATVLLTTLLMLLGLAAVTASQAQARAAGPATRKIVVRPVTSHGTAAKGYRVVVDHRTGPVECYDRSRAAVDPGIEQCGSNADYTPSCWAARTPGHVVCLRDPFSHVLYRIRLSGAFPATRQPAHAYPQALRLADGGKYLVRIGGAWTAPKDHPSWFGVFAQLNGSHALYGSARRHGIDRSQPRWVVNRYASHPTTGTRVAVTAAYYVGTAR